MRCLTKWLLSSISETGYAHMYMKDVCLCNLTMTRMQVYMHMTTTCLCWHCCMQNIGTHVDEYCPMCACVRCIMGRSYCWACRLFSCDACIFYIISGGFSHGSMGSMEPPFQRDIPIHSTDSRIGAALCILPPSARARASMRQRYDAQANPRKMKLSFVLYDWTYGAI